MAKRRGGQHASVSARQEEILGALRSRFPTVEWDDKFNDAAKWRELVTSSAVPITGKCGACGVNVTVTSKSQLTNNAGLTGCKCNAPKKETKASKKRKKEDTEVPQDPREQTPSLASSSSMDPTTPQEVASREEVPAMRGSGPWKKRFEEATAEITRRFPNVELDEKFRTKEGWAKALGESVLLTGKCTGCDVPMGPTSIYNLLKTDGQGFGTSHKKQCVCAVLASAKERAAKLLLKCYVILRMELKEEDWGDAQNNAYVHTKCTECQRESCTRGHSLGRDHQPACWCSNTAPWRDEQGFEHFCAIVDKFKDTRFYEAAFDKDWWMQNVTNCKSKIPMRCTLCNESRDILITSIQQGNGGGCACARQGQLVLKNFLHETFPRLDLACECEAGYSPKTDRMLRFDFGLLLDSGKMAEQLRHICAVLEIGTIPSSTPIYIELDGDHHFSGKYDHHDKSNCAYNDHIKESTAVDEEKRVIRITWRSIMWHSPSGPSWKSYMLDALRWVLTHPGGCVLHPDLPCYTTWEESAYVKEHAPRGCIEAPLRGDGYPVGTCVCWPVPVALETRGLPGNY